MHSDFMKMLCHAAYFINSIGALHLGLMAFGYNILGMGFLANLAVPFAYLFCISGVVGLVMSLKNTFFCESSSSGCSSR